MIAQRIPNPVQLRNSAEKRYKKIHASRSGAILELLEKKKPGTECRAWDGVRIRGCGLAGAPAPGRLFCRNDVRPFVVGFRVSFVLAGSEEIR